MALGTGWDPLSPPVRFIDHSLLTLTIQEAEIDFGKWEVVKLERADFFRKPSPLHTGKSPRHFRPHQGWTLNPASWNKVLNLRGRNTNLC